MIAESQLIALVPHFRCGSDQTPAVGRVGGSVSVGVGCVSVVEEVEDEEDPEHNDCEDAEGLEVGGGEEALEVEAEGPQAVFGDGGGGGGGGGGGRHRVGCWQRWQGVRGDSRGLGTKLRGGEGAGWPNLWS